MKCRYKKIQTYLLIKILSLYVCMCWWLHVFDIIFTCDTFFSPARELFARYSVQPALQRAFRCSSVLSSTKEQWRSVRRISVHTHLHIQRIQGITTVVPTSVHRGEMVHTYIHVEGTSRNIKSHTYIHMRVSKCIYIHTYESQQPHTYIHTSILSLYLSLQNICFFIFIFTRFIILEYMCIESHIQREFLQEALKILRQLFHRYNAISRTTRIITKCGKGTFILVQHSSLHHYLRITRFTITRLS